MRIEIHEFGTARPFDYQWIVISDNGREIARSTTKFKKKSNCIDSARNLAADMRNFRIKLVDASRGFELIWPDAGGRR